MALYLDSSAFVKVLIAEPESGALREYLSGRPERRVSSAILRTEALRAVRHLGSDALATVRDGLRNVDLVAIDDRILDAIHVATAPSIGDDLAEIVTYDDRMAEAARLLGLQTTSPQ